jgi:peptidase E
MRTSTIPRGIILTSLGLLSRVETEKLRAAVVSAIGRETMAGLKVAVIAAAAEILVFKQFSRRETLWWDAQDCETRVINLRDAASARADLEWADVVYVLGGNTYHLMYWLQQAEVSQYIHELLPGLIYIGESAGSIVAGPNITTAILTADYNLERQYRDVGGLSLVPFLVWPHHSAASRIWMLSRERLLPATKRGGFASNVEPIRNGEILIYTPEGVNRV